MPDGQPFLVNTDEVLKLLGRSDEPEFAAQVQQAIIVTSAVVRSYTRRDFIDANGEVNTPDDIAAVVITASARLACNPQMLTRESVEGYEALFAAPNFTIPEYLVLNRWRKTTWP